ncbi:hypothetical protein GMLC_33270 [Geomonas limicola]|uniref:Uncharacterized protein n=1 Tax=Geomonas limicola TaxID=2740186 RepID=A0A6V8NAV8_9BACT|nr:hypothetical protein [Geomonas limicola]GFO69748.1 hypothetical protein GMLC_33270 [Geomonas limicola]
MKIKALRNHDTKTIEGILAALTLKMLPHPYNKPPSLKFDSNILDAVMREVRTKLNIIESDDSSVAQAKLYNFIVNEISRAAFKGKNSDDAKKRLGQKGVLRSDLYKIEYTKNFWNSFFKLYVRPAHIEEAIHYPDEVEHLIPEKFGFEDGSAASLYMKNVTDSNMSLVVTAARHGSTQTVISAWRVYYDDIDLNDINMSSPLGMLRAFVHTYGINLNIGNKTDKFFLYEKITTTLSANTEDDVNLVHFVEPHSTNLFEHFMLRKLDDSDSIEIAFAYAINLSNYLNDLKRHK